jgi:hypothetical protein
MWYKTKSENKFDANEKHEYLGDRESIWNLWYRLTKILNEKYVEVYSLDGRRQTPELGLQGLIDYS